MLLIWDIHITSKIKTQVLDMLREFIASKNEEKNIVFMWDYVYHFSYDKNALLDLFKLFLELYTEWKNIYILSGNHDWLVDTFVYEEWKQVFDLLKWSWALHFITKPWLTDIEWEKVLLLPFCLDLDENSYEEFELWKTDLTESLINSKNKNEVFSWKLNQLVNWFIKKEGNLTIIHHYYTNNQKFPGYRSLFSYKDISLSEELLDNPNVKLISWHLHGPFTLKNYLCTWSVWATSPLESNQIKWLFQYHDWVFSFYWKQIINYLDMEQTWVVSYKDVESLYSQYTQNLKNIFVKDWIFKLDVFDVPQLDIKKTVLSLKVKKLDYDEIDSVMDPKLRTELSDFRLKRNTTQVNDLLEKLKRPGEDELQTFWGWKDLLKEFLKIQYPDDYAKYELKLKELKILD